MKNKVLGLLILIPLLTLSCIRIVLPEETLKGKSFCDSCRIITGELVNFPFLYPSLKIGQF